MKIKLHFNISHFSYNAPITVLNSTLINNQVLNILIYQEDNHGENLLSSLDLSALPNFFQYNLRQWQYTLNNFFQLNTLNLDHIRLDCPLFNMVDSKDNRLYEGELLFIIESVLFAIIEKKVPEVLTYIKKEPISINALYSNSLKMETLPDCLKIKIRPHLINLNETTELIKYLLENKPDIRLRLDGNRQFELLDLTHYIGQLKRNCGPNFFTAIEYLEEPLKNFYDTYSFNQLFSCAIAIDESLGLYKKQLALLGNFPSKTNFILKPSLFGISKSFEILAFTSRLKQNVVISSAYEPASAIRPLLFLAALNPNTHHGFDTLKFMPKHLSLKSDDYCLNF